MAILRWDSGKEAMFIQSAMSKLYDYALSTLNADISSPTPWIPPCDIYENSNSFILKAETPGMSLDDIALEVDGDTVIVMGVRKKRRDVRDESYHRIERSYGRFVRKFILPSVVDENSVTTELSGGLLKMTIGKLKRECARHTIEAPIK